MLDQAGAWAPLCEALAGLDPDDVGDLARSAARASEIVYSALLPDDLADEIRTAYAALRKEYGDDATAVRSSATAALCEGKVAANGG